MNIHDHEKSINSEPRFEPGRHRKQPTKQAASFRFPSSSSKGATPYLDGTIGQDLLHDLVLIRADSVDIGDSVLGRRPLLGVVALHGKGGGGGGVVRSVELDQAGG